MNKKCLGCDEMVTKPSYRSVNFFNNKMKFHSQACSVEYHKKNKTGFWNKNVDRFSI